MSEEFIRKDIHDEQINNLHREIDGLKTMLSSSEQRTSNQIAFWGIITTVVAFLFAGMQIGIAIVLYMLSTPHP